MYLYSLPSSWYVTIHNKSIANRDTITIPVCEQEYKIITRQYIAEPQNEITSHCAISGPFIILDLVYSYFYGEKHLENTIETIKMFSWLKCTNAVKMFDFKNDIISKYILLCSIKHVNDDLFYWIIENMSIDSLNDFYEKNINKLLKILVITETKKTIVFNNADNKINLKKLFELIKKNYDFIHYLLSLINCDV